MLFAKILGVSAEWVAFYQYYYRCYYYYYYRCYYFTQLTLMCVKRNPYLVSLTLATIPLALPTSPSGQLMHSVFHPCCHALEQSGSGIGLAIRISSPLMMIASMLEPW